MIGIIPTPLQPDKPNDRPSMVGSQIGGREFVRSMIRFLPPGNTALLVNDMLVPSMNRDLLRMQENDGEHYNSTRIYGFSALAGLIADMQISALHTVTNAYLDQSSYIRSRFARHPFPITSLTHGLSIPFDWEYMAQILLVPTLPCDSIICTSRAARDALSNQLDSARERLYELSGVRVQNPLRLDIVPLGVDTEQYCPRNRMDVRRILGLPLCKTIILYFGRISHSAKADLGPLLAAFREILKTHSSEVCLVVAGAASAEAVSYVQQMAQRFGCSADVLIRAEPTAMEGPLYYSAADIFVSPVETLQESFGISPLEAMASGLPVVVSDWSGYRDTVIHDKTGYRVTTLWAKCDGIISDFARLNEWEYNHFLASQSVAVSIREMTQCLNVLIEDPDKRLTMGQAARKHAVDNFDWKIVIARLSALWHELSDIAKCLPPLSPASPRIRQPEYFVTFRHYATRCLSGLEILDVTEQGRYALHHHESIIMPAGMSGTLVPKLLITCLNFVRLGKLLRSCPTVHEISERLAYRHNVTYDAVIYHIMWLLKYGFFEVRS